MTQLQQVYHIDQMLCNYRKVHTLFITFPESGLVMLAFALAPKGPFGLKENPSVWTRPHTPLQTHMSKRKQGKNPIFRQFN